MNVTSFNLAVEFVSITCCNTQCGITFALPHWFDKKLRDANGSFYCPRGHAQHFIGETEEQKLKKRLEWATEREKSLREAKDRLQRRLSASHGQITKIKNRVGNGVCPCCNRSFQNLKRHMSHMHPDFKKEKS